MNSPPFTTHAVSSADGATIGYRQLGHGPGIVVLHGSMSPGYYHLELAEALCDAFTLYLPDRRGRGLSGPYHDGDGIQQEVEDLEAVLAQTGGQRAPAPDQYERVDLRGCDGWQQEGPLAPVHEAAAVPGPG